MTSKLQHTVPTLAAFAASIGVFFLTHYMGEQHDLKQPASLNEILDRPLAVNAPGCEILGPDGKSLKDEFGQAEGKKVLMPKGTTMTSDCFPAPRG